MSPCLLSIALSTVFLAICVPLEFQLALARVRRASQLKDFLAIDVHLKAPLGGGLLADFNEEDPRSTRLR